MERVLTPQELGKVLKIGRNQVYALMNSKAFPSYRIGNKMFVTEEALEEWLDKIKGHQILL